MWTQWGMNSLLQALKLHSIGKLWTSFSYSFAYPVSAVADQPNGRGCCFALRETKSQESGTFLSQKTILFVEAKGALSLSTYFPFNSRSIGCGTNIQFSKSKEFDSPVTKPMALLHCLPAQRVN